MQDIKTAVWNCPELIGHSGHKLTGARVPVALAGDCGCLTRHAKFLFIPESK